MARMAQDVDLGRLIPMSERVAMEGEPYGPAISHENLTLSDGFVVGNITLPSLTRAYHIETITVSCDKLVVVQVVLGYNITQTTAQQVYRFIVRPYETVVIPVHQTFRTHQTSFAGTNTSIGGVTVRKVLDATPSGANLHVSSQGWNIYDDLGYSASKVMLVVGDSILNGTTGITRKANSMDWLTRGYFQARGVDIRVINKSISSSTSSDHEIRRASGAYDVPQVDYLHYQLGMNDAGTISAATAQANCAAMIAWKQQRYPKATMVVWGATPREDNTTETALAAIRTAQQSAVTAAADPKVLFCSLGSAFDRTAGAAVYASTDTAGQRVHPNDAGHAAAYSMISGFLTAQNVKL